MNDRGPPKPCTARVAPMKGRIKECGVLGVWRLDNKALCTRHYKIRRDKAAVEAERQGATNGA